MCAHLSGAGEEHNFMAKVRDMTQGRPARLILSFALPLMLGNMFQQMYVMVDTMVVGKFVGVDALASLAESDGLSPQHIIPDAFDSRAAEAVSAAVAAAARESGAARL